MAWGRSAPSPVHRVSLSRGVDWHMLSNGELYRDPGPDSFTRQNPDRVTKRLIRQLEALGHHVTIEPRDLRPRSVPVAVPLPGREVPKERWRRLIGCARMRFMLEETTERSYTTALLTRETWEDFVALVQANNGVWGGCWCMGFHPEGLDRTSARHNRENKHSHVRQATVHQVLVYDGKDCVGWCQYGTPAELPTINNANAYDKQLIELPDWRIGCIFTGKGHRRNGVARAAVSGALSAIKAAGGGLVEAYPEQVEGRKPQRGAYLHTGPENLFEELGFTRDRRIAKWRWVMRCHVRS